MNVLHSTGRKVVVHHQVDAFEIDPTSHERRADEHPDFTCTKAADHVISLKDNNRTFKNIFNWLCQRALLQFECKNT